MSPELVALNDAEAIIQKAMDDVQGVYFSILWVARNGQEEVAYSKLLGARQYLRDEIRRYLDGK